MTDAAGTFSLPGVGVAAVAISCRYCISRTVAVASGEPVVAIVRRFDALFYDSPSPQDLANLPYAHVESAMALRPFMLLRQTTGTLPGSQLADRGLLPSNALLIDAGVPDYDFSFGATPYDEIPANYEHSGSVASPADAFLYGDRAGSGIVSLDPFGGDSALATVGGDTILRLEGGTESTGVVAGTYSNDTESRQRTDGRWTIPISGAETLFFSGGSAQNRSYGDPTSTLNENFSFASGVLRRLAATVDMHAGFIADRGGYLATSGGLPIGDVWSDAQYPPACAPKARFRHSSTCRAGCRPGSTMRPRTPAADRRNADPKSGRCGLRRRWRDYDLTAGVGLFGLGYTGGSGGASDPGRRTSRDALAERSLLPNSKWTADFKASGSLRCPRSGSSTDSTKLRAFIYDRNSLYKRRSRIPTIRVYASASKARHSGFAVTPNGLVTSTGVSVAWQVAPTISLRAWTMYVADTTAPPPVRSCTQRNAIERQRTLADVRERRGVTRGRDLPARSARSGSRSNTRCVGLRTGFEIICAGTPASKIASAPRISTSA